MSDKQAFFTLKDALQTRCCKPALIQTQLLISQLTCGKRVCIGTFGINNQEIHKKNISIAMENIDDGEVLANVANLLPHW